MTTFQEPLSTSRRTQRHATRRERFQPRPEPHKPWWREPWPWILMAGPFAAMVACIVTMVLAAQGFDAQAIGDGGRKQGLVVSKPAALATHTTPAAVRSGATHDARRTP